jgi:hypothetical protein
VDRNLQQVLSLLKVALLQQNSSKMNFPNNFGQFFTSNVSLHAAYIVQHGPEQNDRGPIDHHCSPETAPRGAAAPSQSGLAGAPPRPVSAGASSTTSSTDQWFLEHLRAIFNATTRIPTDSKPAAFKVSFQREVSLHLKSSTSADFRPDLHDLQRYILSNGGL